MLKVGAIFEFDASNMSPKKLRQGQQQAGEVSGTKKKQLEEHVPNNMVDWQQEYLQKSLN